MINTVREVCKNDLYNLLDLYKQLGDNPFPKDTKHLNHIWDEIINNDNYHIIVYEEDNKIISSCTVVIIPNLTHNVRPYAFVENVVTDINYRKKGLATKCLNYAKEISIKNNCYKMMLLTGSKREITLNFYKEAGYNMKDKTAFVMWL